MNPHRNNRVTRGFSLVELMVTMVIVLIMMSGISSILINTKQTNQIQNVFRRMQENGRYGIDLIASDLRRSGYWGGNVDLSLVVGTTGKASAANTCRTGDNTWGRMIDQPLFGLNDTNAGYSCIPDSAYTRGDILVTRYASEGTADTLSSNRLYLRTSLFEGRIFKGSNTASNLVSETPQTTRELVAHAFYIGPSDQVCATGTTIPALIMETLDANGRPTAVAQIIGAEHLVIQYGIDAGFDGSIETYVDADAVTNWGDVAAVRFWLMLRAECPDPGFTDTNTYVMGGQTYVANDNFRRRVHTATVALRN